MDQALLWGSEHTDLLTGFGIGFASLFILAYPFVVFRSRPRKVQTSDGETTMKRAREEYVRQDRARRLGERQFICEMFEDGLLDLYAKDQISNSAYNYWHGHFAVLATVPEFSAINTYCRSTEELKEVLKKRRNGGTYHGIYIPVNLPKVAKEAKTDVMEQFLLNFKR